MEFFQGKTLIFKEFFLGEQRFHGIFREKSTFSRISSGVDPFLTEVFRDECSLVRGKKKSYSSTGGGEGVDIKCNSPLEVSTLIKCVCHCIEFIELLQVTESTKPFW